MTSKAIAAVSTCRSYSSWVLWPSLKSQVKFIAPHPLPNPTFPELSINKLRSPDWGDFLLSFRIFPSVCKSPWPELLKSHRPSGYEPADVPAHIAVICKLLTSPQKPGFSVFVRRKISSPVMNFPSSILTIYPLAYSYWFFWYMAV